MARSVTRATVAGPWLALGGKTRRFQNVETGETLSRRQWDKLYGSLARKEASSYEAAAKRTPEEIRKARPARARKVGQARPLNEIATAKAKRGHVSRAFRVPFVVYIEEGTDVNELEEQAEPYRGAYERARSGVFVNPYISAARIMLEYTDHQGIIQTRTLIMLSRPDALPDFDAFIDRLPIVYQDYTTRAIIFALHYKSENIPPKRKRAVKGTRRAKKNK